MHIETMLSVGTLSDYCIRFNWKVLMDIRILGWEASGLRGALEEFRIDLSDLSKPNVLIQMPTGTGKTTTMTLFRKALSGDEFSRVEVDNLRAESLPNTGRFSLDLALDDYRVKVVIDFDFEEGTASYTTIRIPGGNRRGFDLPEPYDRLLTSSLSRLFVFDGELAAELRDRSLTRADEAIEALYRLSELDSLKSYADEVLRLKQKRNVHVKGKKRNVVTQRRTERDEASRRLGELMGMRAEIVGNREKLDGQLKSVLEEIRRLAEYTDKLESEFNKAKESVRRCEADLDETFPHVYGQFVRPQNLHTRIADRLSDCYSQIDAAKLPGPSSSEWFEWLAHQQKCVCGRAILEHEREVISSHKERYLGGEQHGLINSIKYALKAGAAAQAIDRQLIDELDQAAARYTDAVQKLEEIEDRRVREAGGDIDGLRKHQHELEGKIAKLNEQIEKLDSSETPGGWQESIPLCVRELERREKALNEAEGTYELFQKVEKLKDLLEQVRQGTIARVRVAIQKRTNQKLVDVIHAERLSIDAIDNALMLTGVSRRREDVSVGQSLAIAYAFLTSLFEHASYRLPFVVDSPAGPIDIETRKSVSRLLPRMFPQLIMFVQSGERVGFVEAFYERENVQYLTCWREGGIIRKELGQEAFDAFHLGEIETLREERVRQ